MERYHLIAIINGKDLRITDIEKNMTKDFKHSAILDFIKSGQLTVSGLKVVNGELAGSNGSLDRYTHINDGRVKNLAIVILKRIEYSDGRKEYIALNENGKQKTISNDEALALADKFGIANGKVVEKDGNKFLSSIIGEWDTEQVQCEVKKLEAGAIQKLGEGSLERTVSREVETAKLDTKSKFREKDDSGITVEEKLLYAVNKLMKTDYVLYAIFTQLEKEETFGKVNTLAVTNRKFYFNSSFIMKLTKEETAYVVMHETLHILMKHTVRGIRHAHHDISNIAADIMVNSFIEQNYGESQRKHSDASGMKFPEGGIEAIDIDYSKTTFDDIYNELVQQRQQQQQSGNSDESDNDDEKQDNQNSQNNQSNQSKQSSNNNSDSDDKDKDSSNGEENEDSSDDSNSSEGQSGSSSEDMDGNGSGNGEQSGDSSEDSDGSQSGSSCGQGGEDDEQQESGATQGNSDGDLEYNGQKIKGKSLDDIKNERTESGKSESEIEQEVNTLLKRAETMAKQKGQGSVEALRQIEMATARKINWNKYVEKFLVENKKYYNTFSRPDRRFLSRGETIPGRKLNDNDKLDGVKFCIDTSGSMGDKEIGEIFTQIVQLVKKYKVGAEVIYWNDTVIGTEKVEDNKSLIKAYNNCKGGGGTNINCVFDFFNNRKKEKDIVKPSLLVIFTDAYFGNIVKENSKFYKNKILWVLSEDFYTGAIPQMEALGKIVKQK